MTVSADWQDFATMIGGASGALTGPLFVAVSLNANRIAGHAGFPSAGRPAADKGGHAAASASRFAGPS
jgi:hypothetical protein